MKLKRRKISESLLFSDPLPAGILLTVLCGFLSLSIHSSTTLAYHFGMILVTQGHIALACFFFFTSPSVQAAGSWKRLLPLLGISIVLSTTYLVDKPLVNGLGLVFLYFTWHMSRDEVFFRAPKEISTQDRVLLRIPIATTCFLIYIFTVGKYLIHALRVQSVDAKDMWITPDYRQEITIIAGIAVVLSALTFMIFAKKYSVSWIAFYRKYKRVLNVFLGFFGICFLTCWFRFNVWMTMDTWITYHVCSWYWFSIQKIRRSPSQAKNWKDWPRSTAGRFSLIYGSVQLIIILGFILFFYGGADDSFLKYYYSRSYFNVWTIFHFTLSLFPKGKPVIKPVESRLSPASSALRLDPLL